MRNTLTRQLVLAALFAALTAVCSQIQIPLPMIPINLALFAVHLCGALLGAVYDALGALRRGRLLTAAADLLFGVLAAAAVIAAALVLRCDAYRLYTLLGVGAGFALYQCSIGTTVRFLKGRFRKLSEKEKN